MFKHDDFGFESEQKILTSKGEISANKLKLKTLITRYDNSNSSTKKLLSLDGKLAPLINEYYELSFKENLKLRITPEMAIYVSKNKKDFYWECEIKNLTPGMFAAHKNKKPIEILDINLIKNINRKLFLIPESGNYMYEKSTHSFYLLEKKINSNEYGTFFVNKILLGDFLDLLCLKNDLVENCSFLNWLKNFKYLN